MSVNNHVNNHEKRGFTLVELLVVIAIIAMLVTLLLPAVQAAREAARTIQCKNNLKQMGLSLLNYHDAVGEYPLGVYGAAGSSVGYGWATKLLPFIEEQGIYDLIAVNYISGKPTHHPGMCRTWSQDRGRPCQTESFPAAAWR